MTGQPTALVTGPSALVSGATGLLGGRLAALLHERGYRVRALARATGDVAPLQNLGVEIVLGDVNDPGSLQRAVQGQRFVFHSAGKVSDWGAPADFLRVNRDGTANVIAACQASGVERLLHVGSLTVLGLPRDGRLVDETTPPDPELRDPYSVSKLAAEKLVRAAHGQGGLATTVVRPGVIWGPGDLTIVPRIVALLRRGALPYIDQGRNLLGLSHVDNLAAGCLLAAESPVAAGQLYHLLDDEELTARQVIEALAEAHGLQPPRRSLPFAAVYAIATALELGAKALGRQEPPPLTRYGSRLVACHCRYDRSKARRELGFAPQVKFREGVRALALAA